MIRYIYTFFVGLILAIFIGLGVAVFYEAPKAPESPNFYGSELTVREKEQQKAFDVEQRAWEKERQEYNRNASIIVLSCAIVILIISLLFSEKLGVIADGLLLGGIFTLLYGIGLGMATDNNQYRFAVAAVGLAITLVLGYVKFSRHQIEKS